MQWIKIQKQSRLEFLVRFSSLVDQVWKAIMLQILICYMFVFFV
jgi:hypothetical protein